MKEKKWDVFLLENKSTELKKDAQFFTSDTDAQLSFEVKDEEFTVEAANITLFNLQDGSVVNESMEVSGKEAKYPIRAEVIARSGRWVAQVIFTSGGEEYTAESSFFYVEGHLLDKDEPRIQIIGDFNRTIKTLVDIGLDEKYSGLERQFAQAAEVEAARGQFASLSQRLTSQDNKIAERPTTGEPGGGTPSPGTNYKEVFETLSELSSFYPQGDSNNHAVLFDGMIYTYTNRWVSTEVRAEGTEVMASLYRVQKGVKEVNTEIKKAKGKYPGLAERMDSEYLLLSEGLNQVDEGVKNLDGEVKAARGTHSNLSQRLLAADQKSADIYVSVKSFGAAGDGVNDDTKAIQDTLDFIETKGGGTVLVPIGNYVVKYCLLLPENTTLLGNHAKLLFQSPAGGAVIATKNVYTPNLYYSNVHVEGIHIDASQAPGANGIGLCRVKNGSISKCYSSTIDYHLVDINSCHDMEIFNCKAENSKYEAFQVDSLTETGSLNFIQENGTRYAVPADDSTSERVHFHHNTALENRSAFHIHRDRQSNIKITDNYIFSTVIEGRGVISDIGTLIENVTIRDNEFDSVSHAIFFPGNVVNLLVENNVFRGRKKMAYCFNGFGEKIRKNITFKKNTVIEVKYPIAIQNATDLKVLENTFIDCANPFDGSEFTYTKQSAVSHYVLSLTGGKGILIEYNTFDGCMYGVVRLELSKTIENVEISKNLSKNGSPLVGVVNSAGSAINIKIIENDIQSSEHLYYPIRLVNFSNLITEGNKLEGKVHGIFLSSGSNVKLLKNKIYSENVPGTVSSGCTFENITGIEIIDNDFPNSTLGEKYISLTGTSTGFMSHRVMQPYPTVAKTSSLERVFNATEKPTTDRFASGSVAKNLDLTSGLKEWIYNGTVWKSVMLS